MHFGMISRVFAWRWDNFPKMGYAKYWICGCFSNLNVYIRLEIDYDEPIKSFHVFALKAKEGEHMEKTCGAGVSRSHGSRKSVWMRKQICFF